MDTRRLSFLLELAREGSMRAVADLHGTSTSTVSQQLALLSKEVGTPLITAAGRGVRLTPAGARLAIHAEGIVAAVDAAHHELDPDSEPAGTVRISGFATAMRRTVLPLAGPLAEHHPRVHLQILEHEPSEALALLAKDRVDLVLTYDYDVAPLSHDTGLKTTQLWSTPWQLGVPTADAEQVRSAVPGASAPSGLAPAEVFTAFSDRLWIGNSRNKADEIALRVLSSIAGFDIQITHEADSLELVQDLILEGMGVGLLPSDRDPRPGVSLLPLPTPGVNLRAFAQVRRGREGWPALALVLALIAEQARPFRS